jgi:hypothetical protein
VSRRTTPPRIGLIVITLVGIVLASAGLATAVTMSVSAPVRAEAELLLTGDVDDPRAVGRPTAEPSPSEAWKPMPVDAAGSRSITDLTDGATTRVTVDVLGMDVSPGQAGALVATILSLPLVVAVAVLVTVRAPRRRLRALQRRPRG